MGEDLVRDKISRENGESVGSVTLHKKFLNRAPLVSEYIHGWRLFPNVINEEDSVID